MFLVFLQFGKLLLENQGTLFVILKISLRDKLLSDDDAEKSLEKINQELNYYKLNGKFSNERSLQPHEQKYLEKQIEKWKLGQK